MKIAISELAHHPLNSEIYELGNIDDLASSISQLGLLQALVIDKQNKIISGNRRFAALKKLGWDSATVQQIDVEQRAAEFIVHYNKQRVKKVKEIVLFHNPNLTSILIVHLGFEPNLYKISMLGLCVTSRLS